MSQQEMLPDPPLTEEQHSRVATLSDAQIKAIDDALMANITGQWRKVARVVGTAMLQQRDRVIGIPDLFYAERVKVLVAKGAVEAAGNLNCMRFSEVRLHQSEK
jgi:hypothetical protein